jgi:hypothetical protein
MNKTVDKCENCTAFLAHGNPGLPEHIGHCRLNPPVTGAQMVKHPLTGEMVQQLSISHGFTNRDGWCRQFEQVRGIH